MAGSLRTKLMLSHLGLVLLAMVVLAFYLLQSMNWFYLGTVQERMRDEMELLVDRLGPELAAGDEEAIQTYLAEMGRHVPLRVLVADAEGVIVGSTEPEESYLVGHQGLSRGLSRALGFRIEQIIQGADRSTADVVYLVAPIDWGESQVGSARLSYQLGDLYNELEALTAIILVGLAVAAGAGTLVSLALAYSLSAPARRLAAAARALSAGDLGSRVKPRGNDEIRDAGRAFDALADRLQQLERARQQLLGDVAHDIHSSITGVSMAVEALQRGAVDDPPMRSLLLDGLASHSRRLVRMADDLLEAARIEGGRLHLQREKLSPSVLVCAVAAEFAAEAAEAGVQVEIQIGSELPALPGDRERLAQALGNLVENAIRHTTAGGKVAIGGEVRDGECLLFVRDDGPGIPEDDLPRLFDRFNRFLEGRPGRMGFGLAIAKGLVDAHGGRIEVASASGCGATFTIALPLGGDPEY